MEFDLKFLFAIFNIVISDIVLAGDNAVVIAMAVRSLPERERRLGTLLGASVAVALRIVLTFFVAQMMNLPYLKLVGGLLILWIAVKVLVDNEEHQAGEAQAGGLMQAMWMILVADLTMSLDNVLAVAGASHGNLWLLIFGLGLSIPLVVFASSMLSTLMDKYPVIAYLGSMVLGRVGAEMILGDPLVSGVVHLGDWEHRAVEVVAAVGVLVVAKLWMKRKG